MAQMLRSRACLTAAATSALCVIVCAISLNSAQALSCLTGTQRFELTSEPAYWSIVLPSGVQCTQELRYPPLFIEDVTIITPPRNGSLVVEGPSFRYLPNPEFNGLDSFVLSVSGSNGRVNGSTFIYVDVTVR
jgi:Bacterial Ig domain